MLEDNLKNDADPKSEDYLREESDSKSVTTSKKKNPICNLNKSESHYRSERKQFFCKK